MGNLLRGLIRLKVRCVAGHAFPQLMQHVKREVCLYSKQLQVSMTEHSRIEGIWEISKLLKYKRFHHSARSFTVIEGKVLEET